MDMTDAGSSFPYQRLMLPDVSAESLGYTSFNIIIQIKDPSLISDAILARLALDALLHVKEQCKKKDSPMVVSAILSEDKIYLYSSVKGGSTENDKRFKSILLDETRSSILAEAYSTINKRDHACGNKCGELMAISGWGRLPHESKILKGKIVAVGREGSCGGPAGVAIKQPCGKNLESDQAKFGCQHVIENLKDLELIPMETIIPEVTQKIDIEKKFHTDFFAKIHQTEA